MPFEPNMYVHLERVCTNRTARKRDLITNRTANRKRDLITNRTANRKRNLTT